MTRRNRDELRRQLRTPEVTGTGVPGSEWLKQHEFHLVADGYRALLDRAKNRGIRKPVVVEAPSSTEDSWTPSAEMRELISAAAAKIAHARTEYLKRSNAAFQKA